MPTAGQMLVAQAREQDPTAAIGRELLGTRTSDRAGSVRGSSLHSDVVLPRVVVTQSDPPVRRVSSRVLENRRSATVRPEAGSRRVSS